MYSVLFGLLAHIYVPNNHTEKEFLPYIKEFEEVCDNYFYSKTVVFKDFKGDTLGDCLVYPINPWKYRIRIDKTKWKMSSTHERRLLLYHELSHAIGVNHYDDLFHYMYYRENHSVGPYELKHQLLEIVKKHCNKK